MRGDELGPERAIDEGGAVLTLATELAWPIAAVAIVLSVLAAAMWALWFWRHPSAAAQRLDRAEALLEPLAGDVEKLKARVAQAEATGAFATTAGLVARLRPGDGR